MNFSQVSLRQDQQQLRKFKSSFLVYLIYSLGFFGVVLRPVSVSAQSVTYDDAPVGGIQFDETTAACTTPLTRDFSVTESFTLQDVNLGFNADHTYRGDIQLKLIHPDGTEAIVVETSNDSTEDYDLLLDDSGNATSPPLYNTSRTPDNPLSIFDGKSSQGTWNLEICDAFNRDSGTYNSSSLILDDTDPSNPPDPPSGFGDFCYLVADGQGSTDDDVLTVLDRNTGNETGVSNGNNGTSTSRIEAIAYNPITEVLYAGDRERFGRINLNTGVFTRIGNTDFTDIDGMAFDPFTGDIFASIRRSGLDQLIKINPNNGTLVPDAFGPGINTINIAATSGLDDIDDITISPITGEIFGIANDGGVDDLVVKIDRLDGSTTLVGDPGVGDLEGFSSFQSGISFSGVTGDNSDGTNSNKFFSIDSNTGIATFEHDLGINIGNGITNDYEAIDCSVYPPNVLSGKVFSDTNQDSNFNNSDSETANVTVRLFRDLNNDGVLNNNDDTNNDGVLDDGDILTTRETDNSGNYSFDLNATGAFIVNVDSADLTSGTSFTTNGGNNLVIADFGTTSGMVVSDRNFGHVDLDYGDAAISYDNTADDNNVIDDNDNPARHVVANNLYLGNTAPDLETSPLNSVTADGDDTGNDDEDAFATLPISPVTGSYSLDVPVVNTVSNATLHGWIDFNLDGKFESNEYQSVVVKINDTSVTLNWTISSDTVEGNTQARLRLTSDTLTDDTNTTAIDERSVGNAADGEIEDYPITIKSPVSPPSGNSCISLISPSTSTFNSANYSLNTELQNSSLPLSLYGGTIQFNASLSGTAIWSNGVQIQTNGTIGDHIYLQPREANNYLSSDNQATYTLSFPNGAEDLSMVLGGLNNDDGTTISASYQGTAISITNSNFSNLSTGMGLSDNDDIPGDETVVSTNQDGSPSVIGNDFTLTIPGIIDTLTVVSGKEDGSTGNVTIGMHSINYKDCSTDYSDSPADGGTAPDGSGINAYGNATHGIVNGIRLGINIDAETVPQNSAGADGDDNNGTNDDEDGITIPALTQEQTATITANVSGAGGYLQGWMDWNGNGSFEAGEQVATDFQDNGTGDTDNTADILSFDVSVPAGAITTADTFARFRWSTTSGLDTTTIASNGEVEDYSLAIAPAPLCPTAKADLWFANDESGSVSPAEFENALDFLYQISDGFIYDDSTGIKAGITGWTDQVNSINIVMPITESFGDVGDFGLFMDGNITLNDNTTGIRELYSSKQNTSPGTRLDYATSYLASLITAGNGGRPSTPKIAVMLTDANSAEINAGGLLQSLTAAAQLQATGAKVVVILIGDAITAYNNNASAKIIIDAIANEPEGRIVFVPSYVDAANPVEGYIETVSQSICDLTTPVTSDPGLLLVKRITAINPGKSDEIQFNDFIDDPNSTQDNNPLWPDSDEDPSSNTNLYLRGVLDGGKVKPDDEVEYTIYFLSNGDEAAQEVNVCDVVPDHLTYVKDAYGTEIGIGLGFNPTVVPSTPNQYLSNLLNDDEGDFYGAGTAPPVNLCKKIDTDNNLVTVDGTNNNNGAIIVQPATPLPPAISPGQPASSYGFIRFRGKVK